jgi:hypothetical protein
MSSHRKVYLLIIFTITALVTGIAIPQIRLSVLRRIGRIIVVSDSNKSADVIVLLLSNGAGVLEAADLVHSGVSTQVAVFADPPDPVIDREFIRRGIPYEDVAARSSWQLRALGVERVDIIPRSDASDGQDSALTRWCDKVHVRSVIVVSSLPHSRSTRRELRRAMNGHMTQVRVHPTRYTEFDPDRWWKTHDGVRTIVAEAEELSLDFVRHPGW